MQLMYKARNKDGIFPTLWDITGGRPANSMIAINIDSVNIDIHLQRNSLLVLLLTVPTSIFSNNGYYPGDQKPKHETYVRSPA